MSEKALTTTRDGDLFAPSAFEHVQRVAKMFTSSELVPTQFRGATGLANTVIALNMANRLGADPMAVMQSLYIVHGKPAWSSQFIISCINSCGRFEPLRFAMSGEGDKRQCVAWTRQRGSDEKLEGPAVSIDMAKKEGWYGKTGSKWQTMPELMLRYRAATFFGRLYCPEITLGMKSMEEVVDVDATVDDASGPSVMDRVIGAVPTVEVEQAAPVAEPEPTPTATPTPTPAPNPAPEPESDPLADLVAECGSTLDGLKSTLVEIGWDKTFKSVMDAPAFCDISAADRKRLMGAKHGLRLNLQKFGGAK